MGRFNFVRRRTSKVVGHKFIIVCEGTTEYLYFTGIRTSLRLSTLQIDIANPGASDPRSIVNIAIEKREQSIKAESWADGDDAWAVFDGDEHIANDQNNWNDAIQIAESNDIKLAISNPSFELWFLLHFQDQNAHLDRSEALRRLGQHIASYNKTTQYFPEPLGNYTVEATRRALALMSRHHRDNLPTYNNPSTSVCDLVNKLEELRAQFASGTIPTSLR